MNCDEKNSELVSRVRLILVPNFDVLIDDKGRLLLILGMVYLYDVFEFNILL